MNLRDDLQNYLTNVMQVTQSEHECGSPSLRDGNYFVAIKHPFGDFNREIVPPGLNAGFPDGAIGIRADEDFWAVAALPYRFLDLTIQELVEVIWPDVYPEAEFGPDAVGEAAL